MSSTSLLGTWWLMRHVADIEEFGPRGGIVFKPSSNSSVYASYSESFLPKSGEQFKAME